MHRSAHRKHSRESFNFAPMLVVVLIAGVFISLVSLVLFLAPMLGKLFGFGDFERFNAVIDAKNGINVVSLRTDGHDAVVLVFPPRMESLNVIHGYGQYQFSKLYDVGKLDNRGGEVLSGTVSDFLGIPIDGYVKSNRNFDPNNPKKFFSTPGFLIGEEDNFGILGKLSFSKLISSVRTDRILVYTFKNVTQKASLSDGSEVDIIDQSELDSLLRGVFAEDSIRNEKLRVAVLNSTTSPGLGNRAARVISGMGADVVDVGSFDNLARNCRIVAPKEIIKSKTVERIKETFGCDLMANPERIEHRADIAVIMGLGYLDWLTK